MNKSELIDAIAKEANLPKSSSGQVLDAFFKTVIGNLKKGNVITLVGFGTFSLRDRKARTGRNPATGEAIKIKAAKIPAFKPGKALKDAVN